MVVVEIRFVSLWVLLKLTNNNQQSSYGFKQTNVDGLTTHSHNRDDEGEDEDDEADDHQSSHSLGPSWSKKINKN